MYQRPLEGLIESLKSLEDSLFSFDNDSYDSSNTDSLDKLIGIKVPKLDDLRIDNEKKGKPAISSQYNSHPVQLMSRGSSQNFVVQDSDSFEVKYQKSNKIKPRNPQFIESTFGTPEVVLFDQTVIGPPKGLQNSPKPSANDGLSNATQPSENKPASSPSSGLKLGLGKPPIPPTESSKPENETKPASQIGGAKMLGGGLQLKVQPKPSISEKEDGSDLKKPGFGVNFAPKTVDAKGDGGETKKPGLGISLTPKTVDAKGDGGETKKPGLGISLTPKTVDAKGDGGETKKPGLGISLTPKTVDAKGDGGETKKPGLGISLTPKIGDAKGDGGETKKLGFGLNFAPKTGDAKGDGGETKKPGLGLSFPPKIGDKKEDGSEKNPESQITSQITTNQPNDNKGDDLPKPIQFPPESSFSLTAPTTTPTRAPPTLTTMKPVENKDAPKPAPTTSNTKAPQKKTWEMINSNTIDESKYDSSGKAKLGSGIWGSKSGVTKPTTTTSFSTTNKVGAFGKSFSTTAPAQNPTSNTTNTTNNSTTANKDPPKWAPPTTATKFGGGNSVWSGKK